MVVTLYFRHLLREFGVGDNGYCILPHLHDTLDSKRDTGYQRETKHDSQNEMISLRNLHEYLYRLLPRRSSARDVFAKKIQFAEGVEWSRREGVFHYLNQRPHRSTGYWMHFIERHMCSFLPPELATIMVLHSDDVPTYKGLVSEEMSMDENSTGNRPEGNKNEVQTEMVSDSFPVDTKMFLRRLLLYQNAVLTHQRKKVLEYTRPLARIRTEPLNRANSDTGGFCGNPANVSFKISADNSLLNSKIRFNNGPPFINTGMIQGRHLNRWSHDSLLSLGSLINIIRAISSHEIRDPMEVNSVEDDFYKKTVDIIVGSFQLLKPSQFIRVISSYSRIGLRNTDLCDSIVTYLADMNAIEQHQQQQQRRLTITALGFMAKQNIYPSYDVMCDILHSITEWDLDEMYLIFRILCAYSPVEKIYTIKDIDECTTFVDGLSTNTLGRIRGPVDFDIKQFRFRSILLKIIPAIEVLNDTPSSLNLNKPNKFVKLIIPAIYKLIVLKRFSRLRHQNADITGIEPVLQGCNDLSSHSMTLSPFCVDDLSKFLHSPSSCLDNGQPDTSYQQSDDCCRARVTKSGKLGQRSNLIVALETLLTTIYTLIHPLVMNNYTADCSTCRQFGILEAFLRITHEEWKGNSTLKSAVRCAEHMRLSVRSSCQHLSVSSILSEAQVNHNREVPTIYPYVADILIHENARAWDNTIVEIDGPLHFSLFKIGDTYKKEYTMASVVKHCIHSLYGYRVRNIAFDELSDEKHKREAYIYENLLRE